MCGPERALLATIVLAAACASSTAPVGFLPAPLESQRTAYGGWIEVEYGDGRRPERAAGELLAVQGDSLYVLTPRVGELGGAVTVATSAITKAKLTAYDSQSGKFAMWTLLGVFSTASHGFVLVLSAPVWILTGSTATAVQSHRPQSLYPTVGWNAIAPYARFPQGLPPGIDLRTLQSKPPR